MDWNRRDEARPGAAVQPLSGAALVVFLNELLEAERAGAKVLSVLVAERAAPGGQSLLREIAHDEARYCALLTRLIEAQGGTPSKATGAFRDKVLALQSLIDRLELLNRGQSWVVRKLEQALPQIQDIAISTELAEMRDTHRANVAACGVLLESLREQ
jgi:Domain of unknown function (DUF6306)